MIARPPPEGNRLICSTAEASTASAWPLSSAESDAKVTSPLTVTVVDALSFRVSDEPSAAKVADPML